MCVAITVLCGCRQQGGDIMKLVEERDSLKAKAEHVEQRLSDVTGMVATLNSALDTISVEEGLLFVSRNSDAQMSRTDAIKNLERFETVVRHQQERIAQLEADLNKQGSDGGMQGLVEHMKQQIAGKDAEIANLKKELQNKDVDIAKLRRYVESQRSQIRQQNAAIAELDRRNKRQTEALVRQDAVINNCYVLIGSKKDLKRKGIVKSGKIVSDAMMDRSKFAKIDIRKWREISFEAKRPRILTSMPSASYMLTTNGKRNFTLRVTDPTQFWSISNFLVIQTD